MLRRLGIRPEGVAPPGDGVMVRDGEATALPETAWQAVRTPLLTAADKVHLMGFLARLARTRPSDVADRTIDEWLDGTISPSAIPLLRTVVRVATYVADTDTVSADVAVTQLHASARGVRYLHGGWEVLTDALRGATADGIEVAGTATGVHVDADWVHVDVGQQDLRARAVVLAAGTPAACSALLDGPPPSWAEVGDPVTASCLDLALRRPPARSVVLGVDDPLYLIAHAPAARLAPAGQSLVHAMCNHRRDATIDPRQMRARLDTLATSAGIGDDDIVFARYLHRMVVASAAPTPARGGLAGRPGTASSGSARVLVAGDWVGPDGFLADAALASGERAGRAAAGICAVGAAGPGSDSVDREAAHR